MRRYGNLIPLICTTENIERSIKVVLRGSKRKKTKQAQRILQNKEQVIQETIDVIKNGTFRLGLYDSRTIKEGPKEREIQIINY